MTDRWAHLTARDRVLAQDQMVRIYTARRWPEGGYHRKGDPSFREWVRIRARRGRPAEPKPSC